MKARITAITSLFPYGFYVQWTLDKATESGAYKFSVYRSGGSAGPWELLAENLVSQYSFEDTFTVPVEESTPDVVRPNQLNQFRDFWYRVVATAPSGSVTEVVDNTGPLFEGTLADRKMFQHQRKALRDFRLQLKLNGTPVAILKRRHWGQRCTCVDKATRESVRSQCAKCWGTGFIDGYWSPIYTKARRAPSSNSSAVTPESKSDANDIRFWLPDVPALEQDDLIIFLKDNTRWRVDVTTSTQIRLQDTHQVISGQALDKADIVYRIRVQPRADKALF